MATATSTALDSASLDAALLLTVLKAVRKGDFSARLPDNWVGLPGKVADTLNEVIEMNERLSAELVRLSVVVGRNGKIEERASLGPVTGAWSDAVNNVNSLITDRRNDEFLAMLSHELRNPLGAITAAAHVLEVVGSDDENAQRASAVVRRQSSHLTRIVDDLLEVSRVTVGRIALDRVPVDLREIADRTLEALNASGQIAHHRVAVKGEPILVEADAARMEQVLTNLVVNAAKYSDVGGSITVEIEGDDARARVRVIDEGIGIAPELLEHLFDVFVQGGQALDRARGGLGLGLTLVRRLVELQGGTVRALSEGAGKGSTFLIEMPRLQTEAPPRTVPGPASHDGGTLRVLLVDDNEDARIMLRTYLEMRGHRVHEAASGPEAVDAALDVQPDLVLLDLGLPGFDGLEVSRRLKQDMRTRNILLIALTGYGQSEDREKTASLGFQAHLVKPVTPERLDEAFALAVQRRNGAERLATS